MFGTEIWIIDKWMTLITLMKEESTFILSYSKIIIGIILYLVLLPLLVQVVFSPILLFALLDLLVHYLIY